MSNRIEKASIEISDYAQSISKGGTSGMSVEQASVNLGYVRNTTLGANGGIAKTNSLGKLPSSVLSEYEVTGNVNTIGPVTTALGGLVNKYVITNYSSFTPYTVSTTNGTVTVAGDVISYTPLNAAGLGGFTVNGELFTVTVSQTEVVDPEQPIPVVVTKPVIISPVNGATNISNTVTVTSSAFTMISGVDTHGSSNWQISTSSTFDTILYESVDDTVNKTNWTSGTLSTSTTYYIRVRYKGELSGYGSWSSAVGVTTKSSFLPVNEVQQLDSVPVGDNYFGFSVSLSSNGDVILVGAPTRGSVYFFTKVDGYWTTQIEKVPTGDTTVSGYFGCSVALSSDGSVALVGDYRESTNVGAAYVFKRGGGEWLQQQKLSAVSGSGSNFGRSVSLSSDGTIAAIGADGATGPGAVYVYTYSETSWVMTDWFTANDFDAGEFGLSISLSADGFTMVVGAPASRSNVGAAYIFTRSGAVWTKHLKLLGSNDANANFGFAVAISGDGSTILVGSFYGNPVKGYVFTRSGSSWAQQGIPLVTTGDAGSGLGYSVSLTSDGSIALMGTFSGEAAYIFTRSGSTWTQQAKLTASDGSLNDNFGRSVSLSSDGFTALVGAYRKSSSKGAVYIYQ